jgi:hypothetical protein
MLTNHVWIVPNGCDTSQATKVWIFADTGHALYLQFENVLSLLFQRR